MKVLAGKTHLRNVEVYDLLKNLSKYNFKKKTERTHGTLGPSKLVSSSASTFGFGTTTADWKGGFSGEQTQK